MSVAAPGDRLDFASRPPAHRGSLSIPNGSTTARQDPSPTRRTPPIAGTSTRSPSMPTSTDSSPSPSASCDCRWARACESSWTTRTPRPVRPVWEVLFAGSTPPTPTSCSSAEAFTRPATIRTLGTVGFHQGLHLLHVAQHEVEATYFAELSTFAADYMRPNCFVNTPDIRTRSTCSRNEAAFAIRATLAALLAHLRRLRRVRSTSTSRCSRQRRSTSTPRSSSTGPELGGCVRASCPT